MLTKLFHQKIEQKIISNLSKAKSEVKIAVAWFTNPVLYNVVMKLAESNVSIYLILCDDRMNFINTKLDFQSLIDMGAQIRVSRAPQLMHNKFCVIDNRILITGSYNWTLRAEQYNFENIIVSTDKELIIAFTDYFNEITAQTTRIVNIPATTFQSYYNQTEIDLELQLENTEKVEVENFKQKKDSEYSEDIWQAIHKADILYRKAEHSKCIAYCKKETQRFPQIPEFQVLMASAYWRLGDFDAQIKSAINAIEIDNEYYEAYNFLGIGYDAVGKEQLAIKNYSICLEKHPNVHTFLRNRALAYISLEKDVNIPKNIREQQTKKANLDFKKIIDSTKNSLLKPTYSELHSRAIAYGCLGKRNMALSDIDLALKIYSRISDESKLDENELKDMKVHQRKLRAIQKSKK